jgi:hypothetical protein
MWKLPRFSHALISLYVSHWHLYFTQLFIDKVILSRAQRSGGKRLSPKPDQILSCQEELTLFGTYRCAFHALWTRKCAITTACEAHMDVPRVSMSAEHLRYGPHAIVKSTLPASAGLSHSIVPAQENAFASSQHYWISETGV